MAGKALSTLKLHCHIKELPSIRSGIRLALSHTCELTLVPFDLRARDSAWPYAL